LMTSLLGTLIFIWVRRITSSLIWSYVLATVAAFSTLLWPYAYIGFETTQSLFLMLAGYLALGSERQKSWPHTLLFALACVVAVGVKMTGMFLVPAAGFLIYSYFWSASSGDHSTPAHRGIKIFTIISLMAVVVWLGAYTRASYYAKFGGSSLGYMEWMVNSPWVFALNVYSFLFSANKGLILYAPIIILSLMALRQAYLNHPRIVIFAVLTLAGLAGGFGLLFAWAEDTWGPRYLHSAVAPLVICLAVARRSIPFRFRQEVPLVALAVLGAAISFLGSFFYYGALHLAATECSQNTIEALQYDIAWNHPRFNLQLLQVWLRKGLASSGVVTSGEAEQWPPAHHWWFARPPDAAPEKIIKLKDYATPQSALFRYWRMSGAKRPALLLWVFLVGSFLSSLMMLVWLGRLVAKVDAQSDYSEQPEKLGRLAPSMAK